MRSRILLLSLFFVSITGLFAQDVITLTSTDKITDVLSAYTGSANEITIVVPADYTNPQGTTLTDLTSKTYLTSTSKLIFKGDGTNPNLAMPQIKLPAAMGKLEFRDLTITGPNASITSNYLINMGDNITSVLDSFVFKNCNVKNYRSLLRFQNNTSADFTQRVKDIVITNCIMSNFPDYGVLYNNKLYSYMDNIKISNSTFYGFGDYVFNLSKNVIGMQITNCTFDNFGLNTASKRFIVDLSTQTTPLVVTNSIVGRSSAIASTFNTGGTLTLVNSYVTTDGPTVAPAALGGITGELIAFSGSASDLFTLPTTTTGAVTSAQTTTVGNYTLKATTINGVGDPRWYSASGISQTKTASIRYYPNPTTDIVAFDQTFVKAEVYSLLGEKVLTVRNNKSLSVSHLSSGNYLVLVTNENGETAVAKILKK